MMVKRSKKTAKKHADKERVDVNKRKSSKNKKPKKVDSINSKLDKILAIQKMLLKEEQKAELEEKVLENIEKSNELGEEQEDAELKKIESTMVKTKESEDDELSKLQRLEEEIKKEVADHPLKKITVRDVIKGFVGAFIGLAVHYTFTYGVELSEKFDMTRATLLYVLSFFVGIMFIYATGFRKIKDPKILIFMPIRFLVLYMGAIIMSIIVLSLFYPGFGNTFEEAYKNVAGVLLAAVVGACTADLIGKE